MGNKKNVLSSLSVLGPAYIYNVVLGFLPAVVKLKDIHIVGCNGPFIYNRFLMTPSLVIQLISIYWFYDTTVRILIMKQYFLWSLLTQLYIEIMYLFINWMFFKKDFIRVFNDAHRLLGTSRRAMSPIDMLPFLTTYGYILKPIVLTDNFVTWPSINMLLYVRLLGQLSVESVVYAAMRAAEVVLCDLNHDLDLGVGRSVSLHEVAATCLRVLGFVKSVSRSIGALYFPFLIMNVFMVITGNLYAIKLMLTGQGINKFSVVYLIEWSGPLCSMFIVCRRSQAVFVQSHKTKQSLQMFVMKRGPNIASRKLANHICKLIDENNVCLKAGESLVYDSSLWLMMINLILTNMLAILPASKSIS